MEKTEGETPGSATSPSRTRDTSRSCPTARCPGAKSEVGAANNRREFEILEYDEKFEQTTIVGDHAFEWGHISGSEKRLSDGQVLRSVVKVLRILQRQSDGSWRVRVSMFNQANQ